MSALFAWLLFACVCTQDVPEAGAVVELLRATTPQEQWARDERLSFSPSAGRRAARVLDENSTPEDERMVAWMAVGASGSGAYRPRLVGHALEGTPEERTTAILALGEMGPGGVDALFRTLEQSPDGVEEELVLALARTGDESAKRLLLEHSSLRTRRLFTAAQPYVAMITGGLPPLRECVIKLLLLRWEAAKRFGFVDGRRWRDVLTAGLIEIDAFVERWISLAAAELESPVADDYLVLLAREGRAHPGLAGAVERVPERLADLWEAGDWIPDAREARRLLVDSIEIAHHPRGSRRLLDLLVGVDPLNDAAQLALVAVGGAPDDVWIQRQMDGSPEQQVALADAFGSSGESRWQSQLSALSEAARTAEVRNSACVASARLGDAQSESTILSRLSDRSSTEGRALIAALARSAHDPKLGPYLASVGDGASLDVGQRFQLLAGAIERGVEAYPDPLWTWVRQDDFPDRVGVVRALRPIAGPADLGVFQEVFPVDDDMQLNVELVLVLQDLGDPTVRGLLRSAVWRDNFARAILSAGVLVEHYGPEALFQEVGFQGDLATPEHLRRLGVAIAEWTGPTGVERLFAMRGVRPEVLEGASLGSIAAIAREQ